jgi:predicted AlkP superfamily phosphohydrolase/phosphomutase
MADRVFVIGLDGGTLDVLGPWMHQGWLPQLKQLLDEGVSGSLESSIPPMTAPAWSTFMTGKNPGKHGVYDFGTQGEGGYSYQVIDARFRRGKTLWEIISDRGGRVVVLNVPTTYPPRPVNGVLGGDFLTPSGKRDFLYPPELLEEIERRFGRYPLYAIPPYFAVTQASADVDAFIKGYEDALWYTFELANYLLEKVAPQFLMLHLFGIDQISHWLWHIFDAAHPRHRRDTSEQPFKRILEYYQAFDAELGRLLRRADEDTAVIVMSDHGFGPLHKVINLNTWLIYEGYLSLKDTPRTRLRYLLWRLGLTPETLAGSKLMGLPLKMVLKRLLRSDQGTVDTLKKAQAWQQLFLSLEDVDWQRTKAFCLFGWGQIKLNVRGRYAQGVVSPGTEYAALRAEIVQKLKDLRDPDTGECIDDAPDITFLPMEKNYWANSRGTGFASHKVFSDFLWGMTGMHRLNGMFIAKGGGIRKDVHGQRAYLMDLFPSILYLLGLPIPRDIDGRLLEEIVDDAFLKAHPIEYTGEADHHLYAPGELSDQDQAELIKRLRDLGYL